MHLVGVPERHTHQDGGSFSIDLKYYLMTFLAFGLVEAGVLLTASKRFLRGVSSDTELGKANRRLRPGQYKVIN